MRAFTVIGDLGAEEAYGTKPWHKKDVLDYNEKAMDSVGWREKLFAHPTKVLVMISTGTARPEVSDGAKMFKFYENKEKFTEILTKWQIANGIKSDGKIGPQTWTAIQAQLQPGKKPASGGGGKPRTAAPAGPTVEPTVEEDTGKKPWYLNISYPWYIGGGIVLVGLIGLFWPSSPKAQRKSGQLNGYADEPTNVKQLRRAGYMIPERDGSYTMMPPGKRPYNLSHEAALTLVAHKPDPERW